MAIVIHLLFLVFPTCRSLTVPTIRQWHRHRPSPALLNDQWDLYRVLVQATPSAVYDDNAFEEKFLPPLTLDELEGKPRTITLVDDIDGLERLSDAIDSSVDAAEEIMGNGKKAPTDEQAIQGGWGLDCEWKPDLQRDDDHPVSLLQLSAPEGGSVFLLDLQTLCRPCKVGGEFPVEMTDTEMKLSDMLTKLLSNPSVPLLGFSLQNDVVKLVSSFPHLPCFTFYESVIDLLEVANHVHRRNFSVASSLDKAVGFLLGYTLEKEEFQCSEWTQRPLGLDQMEYAALDAAVLPKLLEMMLSHPNVKGKYKGSFFDKQKQMRSSMRITMLGRSSDEEDMKYTIKKGTLLATKNRSFMVGLQRWSTGTKVPKEPQRRI